MSDRAEFEDFLFREAELLDARDYETWLDLFAADGRYWVPLDPAQPEGVAHASIFDEDLALLRMRVGHMGHPLAHGHETPPRTSRIVGNVRLVEQAGERASLTARFHLLEWHEERHRVFAGRLAHRLVRRAEGWRIALKRVDLLDVDAAHESIQIIF